MADDVYACEIEASLQPAQTLKAAQEKPQTQQEMHSAVEDMQTDFGGAGGNLTDMKYIRLRLKTLQITDIEAQQQL